MHFDAPLWIEKLVYGNLLEVFPFLQLSGCPCSGPLSLSFRLFSGHLVSFNPNSLLFPSMFSPVVTKLFIKR